jgi:hypothetical protein
MNEEQPAKGHSCHRLRQRDGDPDRARSGRAAGTDAANRWDCGAPERQCLRSEADSRGAPRVHRYPRRARAGHRGPRPEIPGENWYLEYKKGRFSPTAALRRGGDFGMVPADLRPPSWAGLASFLYARRIMRPGRGAIQDLRQIR